MLRNHLMQLPYFKAEDTKAQEEEIACPQSYVYLGLDSKPFIDSTNYSLWGEKCLQRKASPK